MTRPFPIIIIIILLLILFQAGCTHPSTSRLTLGARHRTPTFAHSQSISQSNHQSLAPAPTPRANWSTTIIIAPVDGIAHNPTAALPRTPRKKDHPRTYALMPTAESALDHQSFSWGQAAFQTLSELGSSISILIDPMILWHQSTSPQWSPQRIWKRSTIDNTWSSGSTPN